MDPRAGKSTRKKIISGPHIIFWKEPKYLGTLESLKPELNLGTYKVLPPHNSKDHHACTRPAQVLHWRGYSETFLSFKSAQISRRYTVPSRTRILPQTLISHHSSSSLIMAAQTPKGQPSSRLLTMKFMQRAAASGSSPTTPKSEDEHSAKRRRTSAGKATPSTPITPLFDQRAVQAALEEEEQKRQAALERQAMELGDSRWVLDIQMPVSKTGTAAQAPLNVVQVGFAQIDASDSPEANLGQVSGLKSFGPKAKNLKRKDPEVRLSCNCYFLYTRHFFPLSHSCYI